MCAAFLRLVLASEALSWEACHPHQPICDLKRGKPPQQTSSAPSHVPRAERRARPRERDSTFPEKPSFFTPTPTPEDGTSLA